jgi:hypothetical protein
LKKKLLFVAVLILSAAIAFAVGVAAFSRDNLENRGSGRENISLAPGSGIILHDFSITDSGYISGEDSQLIINGINGYVNNIRLDAVLDGEVTAVEVFFKAAADEAFSAENCIIAPVSIKNSDIYKH